MKVLKHIPPGGPPGLSRHVTVCTHDRAEVPHNRTECLRGFAGTLCALLPLLPPPIPLSAWKCNTSLSSYFFPLKGDAHPLVLSLNASNKESETLALNSRACPVPIADLRLAKTALTKKVQFARAAIVLLKLRLKATGINIMSPRSEAEV